MIPTECFELDSFIKKISILKNFDHTSYSSYKEMFFMDLLQNVNDRIKIKSKEYIKILSAKNFIKLKLKVLDESNTKEKNELENIILCKLQEDDNVLESIPINYYTLSFLEKISDFSSLNLLNKIYNLLIETKENYVDADIILNKG